MISPAAKTERKRTRSLTRMYNSTTEQQQGLRSQTLKDLFGAVRSNVKIEPP